PYRPGIHAPRRRQEVTMQTGHDDDIALQPHADIDNESDNKKRYRVGPYLLEPEDLRDHYVAQEQRPEHRRVWPVHAIERHELFVRVPAIPRHKDFHQIPVGHDQPGSEENLLPVLQEPLWDEDFEAIVCS